MLQNLPGDFDAPLSNNRDCDRRTTIGGREFNLECTVLTQDSQSRDEWHRYQQAKLNDSSVTYFMSEKGDLNFEIWRFYEKVYEKLAKDLDPQKSQCADNAPNILLLSHGFPLSAHFPASGLALDTLFGNDSERRRYHPQRDDAKTTSVFCRLLALTRRLLALTPSPSPKGRGELLLSHPENASPISDSTLVRRLQYKEWLQCTKQKRTTSDKPTEAFADERFPFDRLLDAPRKLGGIMLFDGCVFVAARVNYNADPKCRVSHSEMAELERLFRAESDRDS